MENNTFTERFLQLNLEPLFAYELCVVPPALIDEHGCLRKSSKSGLMKRSKCVLDVSPAIAVLPHSVTTRRQCFKLYDPHRESPESLPR